MKMYIGGKWVDKAETIRVLNPFDQSGIFSGLRPTRMGIKSA